MIFYTYRELVERSSGGGIVIEKRQKIRLCLGISIGIVLMIVFSIRSVVYTKETISNTEKNQAIKNEGNTKFKEKKGHETGEAEGKQKTGAVQEVDADTVVWGVNYAELPDAAAMKALNQYLQEQGYDFSVAVRQVESAGCDAKTLQEKYPDVDIMQVPPDYTSTNPGANLIREGYYLPLSDYLQKKGKRLKEQIPQSLWKQVKVDGGIYTIPNTALEYRGIYFQFNPKYIAKKYIKEFDGTMQGVRRILYHVEWNLNQIPNPVVIGDSGLFAMNYAELTGNAFCYGLALDEEGDEVVPWYQAEGVREFYELLNNWYNMPCIGKQAFTLSPAIDNELAEQAFQEGRYMVKIGIGAADETKGIVRYAKKRQGSSVNASTGISAKSTKQEWAKEFLELAYTDSHVADLLVYGIEGEDYTLVKGLVKNTDSEGLDSYRTKRINFGNNIANTPLDTAGYTDLGKEMEEYFEKSGQVEDSTYLGFEPDLRGYEETVKRLLDIELEEENVWGTNTDYFYDDYMLLTDRCSRNAYRKYAKEIKRQIEEWKKGKK